MSPNRIRARRWLVERGLSLGYERTLAELLTDAEERVILAIARLHGTALANRGAEELTERGPISPLDVLAQPAEQVTDQHGLTTAPVEGG